MLQLLAAQCLSLGLCRGRARGTAGQPRRLRGRERGTVHFLSGGGRHPSRSLLWTIDVLLLLCKSCAGFWIAALRVSSCPFPGPLTLAAPPPCLPVAKALGWLLLLFFSNLSPSVSLYSHLWVSVSEGRHSADCVSRFWRVFQGKEHVPTTWGSGFSQVTLLLTLTKVPLKHPHLKM